MNDKVLEVVDNEEVVKLLKAIMDATKGSDLKISGLKVNKKESKNSFGDKSELNISISFNKFDLKEICKVSREIGFKNLGDNTNETEDKEDT